MTENGRHAADTQSDQSVEALRESERRFRDLFDNSPDAIFVEDRDGNVLDVNPAACRLHRMDRHSLIGRNVLELVPSDRRQEVARVFPKLILGECDHLNGYSWTKDGVAIPVEIRVNRFEYAGRAALLLHVRDISDRERAEAALRESEKRFSQVAENALEWIWEVDADGLYTYASPVVEKILGYKSDEIVGKKHFYDLFHPEDREQNTEAAFAVFAKEHPFREFVNRNVHKSGKTVWLSTSGVPTLDQQGQLLGYRGADTDITDRRLSEVALRESEERFKSLFEHSPDAIFVEDQDGNVLDVNPAACRLHGMDRRDIIDKNVLELVPPDRREEVTRDFPKLLSGEWDHAEGFSWTKDGRAVPVEIRVNRFQFAGVPALLLHVRDISELRRAQEDLRRRETELAHMARVHDLGEMAASLAHEINQPLYAISNYANGMIQRLRKGTADLDDFTPVLNETLSEAKRAGDIIAHIRRLIRKREPRRSTVDVNGLIRGLDGLMGSEARHRETAVHLELADDLPHVLVDSVQIEQVILNLMRNALDAMSEMPSGQRSLTITSSLAESDAVEIAVHDTGAGLSPEIADKVFDPFFSTKPDGLGMGLAISRSIIEAHGGEILVSVDPPQATTFRFTLPVPPMPSG